MIKNITFFLYSTKNAKPLLYNNGEVKKMTNFNTLFMNSTWILFPIMIFLLYEAYTENVNKKQNELFLYFCMISSLYLIIRCGTFTNYEKILEITLDTIILIL